MGRKVVTHDSKNDLPLVRGRLDDSTVIVSEILDGGTTYQLPLFIKEFFLSYVSF